MSDMGNNKNASDVADTPTPDADDAVDEQTGSDLEGNANDDVVETEDCIVLAYRVAASRGGHAYRAFCSSTWVRQHEDWQMIEHQQTPLAED